MSKQVLAQIVQRAISDGAFRRQLSSDPAAALRGFDLTADESAALRSGDSGRLSALGVDLRMSKAFTLVGDASGEGANVSDIRPSYNSAATTGVTGPGTGGALVSADITDANAMIDAGFTAARISSDSGMNMTGAHTGGDPTLEAADITDSASVLDGAQIGDHGHLLDAAITAGDSVTDEGAVIDDSGASGTTTHSDVGDGNVIEP